MRLLPDRARKLPVVAPTAGTVSNGPGSSRREIGWSFSKNPARRQCSALENGPARLRKEKPLTPMTEASTYRAGILAVLRSALERRYPQLPALAAELDPDLTEDHAYNGEDLYQLAERLGGRKIARRPDNSLAAIGSLLDVALATVAAGYETGGAEGAHRAVTRIVAELAGQPPTIAPPGPRKRLSVLAKEG